ncbi:MAG: four-carbon acid sugar kinase family protein, partial [Gammaproteobacteria bacterium]|nr:four-carbon acid sugar kinase family protein [Gammaproteobacteria bacterium]
MRIALIADDLTGANNAGVGLVKRGFAVATTLRGVTPLPEGYDALCIDTGSRYVAADEARRRVTETARAARAHGAALVCKRIDTLLRGNLGAELDGGLAALGSDALAVVAPAFPDSGRVVDDGHLLVDGAPVDQHPVAAGDRLAPVRHSYVPHLLAEQSAERTVRIDRATVQGGAAAVAAALEGAARGGVRVAVVDAASNEEVQTIARALVSLERAVMPVDPGALSAAYAEACFTPAAHSARRVGRPRGRKVLAAVASTTALTRRQLDRLARDFALEPVRLEAQALIDVPASGEDVVDRAVATG